MDIDIDKVNKPYLPLASGYFSLRQGVLMSLFCGVLALSLAYHQSQILFVSHILLAAFASNYSLPPFNFKYSPVGAALTIAIG